MQAELLENVGRYEIVGELGAGSMSRVYLAHDPNLDRKLAVKIVLQGFSLDNREQNELERRFLLEARAAGKLSHPGIVRVFDADTDPEMGIPYIAMEWVRGRSLRSVLEEQDRLSGPETLDILAQVARALDYAHRAGRIHRDIKPSNILIGADGVAKVSDFGVAKIVSESHTISGQVLGTPAYMSPEQVRDEPLDGRSDLFSLGAVLYQCVSGTTPFGGETLVQVVYKILNVDPRPLQLPTSDTWTRLSNVVNRAIQKDPSLRFQTGSEFADALHELSELLASEPVSDFILDKETHPPNPNLDTRRIRSRGAVEARNPETAGETHTVQLSDTEINHAVGGDVAPPASPTVWDTVTTLSPGGRAEASSPIRLRVLLALIVMVAALAGVALYRLGYFEGELSAPVVVEASTETHRAPQNLSPPADAPPGRTDDEAESPSERQIDELPINPPAQVVAAPRTREMTAKESSPRAVLTPVTILYRHKGGLAYLTVLLDGARVWSQELKAVEGRLQKLSGYWARAVVSVPSGTHTLEVRLSDPERDVNSAKSIRSRYTNGRKRVLRVYLDPDNNEMQLRWKE